jgi:arylformamidase
MTDIDWDDAYANGKYIAGADEFPPRWAEKSERLRSELVARGRAELDIAYGPHPRNRLDLLLPDEAPHGLVVIVHGGYWLAFDKSYWTHLAKGALARGYAVAMPSYVLAPEVKIADITQQIAAAIEVAAGRIAGPIHLTGHSAGGHLVTRMLCSDMTWSGCFKERIARVVSISGLHDLRPLRKTEMNKSFQMSEEDAAAESPLLDKGHLPVPVVAWVGGDERPVFIDQSRWLARDWPTAEIVIEPGRHHFDVIDGLEDPNSALMKALLD